MRADAEHRPYAEVDISAAQVVKNSAHSSSAQKIISAPCLHNAHASEFKTCRGNENGAIQFTTSIGATSFLVEAKNRLKNASMLPTRHFFTIQKLAGTGSYQHDKQIFRAPQTKDDIIYLLETVGELVDFLACKGIFEHMLAEDHKFFPYIGSPHTQTDVTE